MVRYDLRKAFSGKSPMKRSREIGRDPGSIPGESNIKKGFKNSCSGEKHFLNNVPWFKSASRVSLCAVPPFVEQFHLATNSQPRSWFHDLIRQNATSAPNAAIVQSLPHVPLG